MLLPLSRTYAVKCLRQEIAKTGHPCGCPPHDDATMEDITRASHADPMKFASAMFSSHLGRLESAEKSIPNSHGGMGTGIVKPSMALLSPCEAHAGTCFYYGGIHWSVSGRRGPCRPHLYQNDKGTQECSCQVRIFRTILGNHSSYEGAEERG